MATTLLHARCKLVLFKFLEVLILNALLGVDLTLRGARSLDWRGFAGQVVVLLRRENILEGACPHALAASETEGKSRCRHIVEFLVAAAAAIFSTILVF